MNESALLVAVPPFESVTDTLTEKGDPVAVPGAQVTVAEFGAVHPSGSPLQV